MVSAKPNHISDGSCLLAKKKVIGKVSLIQEEDLLGSEQHKNWLMRHLSLETSMNKSKSILDRFIESQTNSDDACSSRLLESKRVLDALLKDLKTLSSQVVSQEQVLETETENLKITKLSSEAVEKEWEKKIEECEEERAEALAEHTKYSAELEELDQIAKPSVRAEISHSVTVESLVQSDQDPEQPSGSDVSFLQARLNKQKCLAFVEFMGRHKHHLVADPSVESGQACDEQREELQEAFTKAYKETRELQKVAKERSVDNMCFETADAKKSSEMVPLVSQREMAVTRIEEASQALAALEPVLGLVKAKSEKLKTHISETLTPECQHAGDASKVLMRVRELIISLEKCPGRQDFKLKIPPADEKLAEEEPAKEATTMPNETPEAKPAVKCQEYAKPPAEAFYEFSQFTPPACCDNLLHGKPLVIDWGEKSSCDDYLNGEIEDKVKDVCPKTCGNAILLQGETKEEHAKTMNNNSANVEPKEKEP